MNNNLHNLAREAKLRIKNGYMFNSEESSKTKILSEIDTAIDGSLNDYNENIKDGIFYKKVKAMLSENIDVYNPLGKLIEREIFDKLKFNERERYILKLSSKYLLCKNKILSEIADNWYINFCYYFQIMIKWIY